MVGDYVRSSETEKCFHLDLNDIKCSDNPSFILLRPVPITEQFLKEQGFGCDNMGVGRERYWLSGVKSIKEAPVIEIYFSNGVLEKIDISADSGPGFREVNHLVFRSMKYVHELQHALKLCRVSGEFLFKDLRHLTNKHLRIF